MSAKERLEMQPLDTNSSAILVTKHKANRKYDGLPVNEHFNLAVILTNFIHLHPLCDCSPATWLELPCPTAY